METRIKKFHKKNIHRFLRDALISVLVVTQTHIFISFLCCNMMQQKRDDDDDDEKKSIYAKIFSCVREVMM